MINRNLPALAMSDAATAQVNWSSSLPATHRAYEVANIVVRLVDALVAGKAMAGGQLMREGVGLNVNVPDFAAGAGAALPYRFTRIGKVVAAPVDQAPATLQFIVENGGTVQDRLAFR